MNFTGIQTNWFDAVVVGVIAAGIYRGRMRGISEELFDLSKWLVWLIVAGTAYRPAGDFMARYLPWSRATTYVATYLLAGLMVRWVFDRVKVALGEKLAHSDMFGGAEYYLGMLAGAARFLCALLVGLALLNATEMTPEQLNALARFQEKNFEDISFPTFGTIQHTIFTGSVSGKFVGRYLEHELIVVNPAPSLRTAASLARRDEPLGNSIPNRRP